MDEECQECKVRGGIYMWGCLGCRVRHALDAPCGRREIELNGITKDFDVSYKELTELFFNEMTRLR